MDLRRGEYDDEELEEQLNKRGLMNRFFGPLARRIDTPWKMYPIGVLFGLGFDTATEVALLVLVGDRGGERPALLRHPVAPDPLRGRHEPVRHDGRLLHELRLRLGVLPADPEGLLQHHDHRCSRSPSPSSSARSSSSGCSPPSSTCPGSFWGFLAELQHQHGRIRHRRPLRRHLGRRAGRSGASATSSSAGTSPPSATARRAGSSPPTRPRRAVRPTGATAWASSTR